MPKALFMVGACQVSRLDADQRSVVNACQSLHDSADGPRSSLCLVLFPDRSQYPRLRRPGGRQAAPRYRAMQSARLTQSSALKIRSPPQRAVSDSLWPAADTDQKPGSFSLAVTTCRSPLVTAFPAVIACSASHPRSPDSLQCLSIA